jgi:anaerobic nitric oxide reductase flavorubredoxin
MQPVEISPAIHWIGVNDRHLEMFEGLWSIGDEGVSYNSYLIVDEKSAIIDLCSKMTSDELFDHVRSITDPSKLAYVVINHMEPDHSGALKALLLLAPKIRLIGTAKTKEMLDSFYGITQNVQVVADGDEINLGVHKLRFFSTPFVHWPETMMTYETTEKILFSCDGFGGYGSLNGCIFDEKIMPVKWYEDQALRYFVNIVANYSKPVKNAIAKFKDLPIKIVAPSHGLIWRNSPLRIIELYQKWADYASGPGDTAVTLLYASMYGSTVRMMEVIAQGIVDAGVPVTIYHVSKAPVSGILPSLWLNRGVVMGAPTYEGSLFPDMVSLLNMAKTKHIFNKKAAGFGSFAWGGGGQREFNELIQSLRWESYGNFEYKGIPDSGDLNEGRKFGFEFAKKLIG